MTAVSPDTTGHPPLVPLVFRVGVTGHRPDHGKRPDPDVAAIRASVRAVLAAVREVVERVAAGRTDLFAPLAAGGAETTRRHVRLVSALAPGPDQWVAREAVKQGFELQCVLPFAREEYRQDLAGPWPAADSEAEFEALLQLASAVFELDGRVVRSESGERLPDGHSYQAAGSAILRQSDLLIALWDGQPARGLGGTGEIVDEALARGIPVVWIPWGRPEAWRMLLPTGLDGARTDVSEADRADLPRAIEALLLPADEADRDVQAAAERREYFRERRKRGNPLLWCWTLFRWFVCGEFLTTRPGRPEETARGSTGIGAGVQAFVDGAFLPHYRWANSLSIHFGRLHRGAFLVTASLGAVAVFLALYSVAAGLEGQAQRPWILAELVVILGILALTHLGRRRRWHQRWIDYRMLAERLRIARCTALLGGGGPLVLHAGHQASYGNPLRTWMHWHYQAIERAAGLPPGRVPVNAEYLAGCRQFWLGGLLERQRRYHERNAVAFATLDRRLHRLADALFALTLAACLLHIAHLRLDGALVSWLPDNASGWLTLLCAFLPAAGSACAAIRGFAETRRLAQRSKAMQDGLARLQEELAGIPTGGGALNLQRLRACADRVGDLMIRETLDWRVVFQD
ncbi:MAG: hypothetical protein H6Q10_3617, partial [Acidobacteria bacterium]|nr:hypothetical protein [Acidobacteriota bacterium]